jgi:hypothetical protein
MPMWYVSWVGNQTPVNLTLNNIRIRENLSGRISQHWWLTAFQCWMHSNIRQCREVRFRRINFQLKFIPNTYEYTVIQASTICWARIKGVWTFQEWRAKREAGKIDLLTPCAGLYPGIYCCGRSHLCRWIPIVQIIPEPIKHGVCDWKPIRRKDRKREISHCDAFYSDILR